MQDFRDIGPGTIWRVLSVLRFLHRIVNMNFQLHGIEQGMTSKSGSVVLGAPERVADRHASHFQVGGVRVQIVGLQSDDVALGSSLNPFRFRAGVPDVQIQVRWVERLDPCIGPMLFDSGSVWRLYECGNQLQFDFNTPVLGTRPYKRFRVDHKFCRGTLEMSREAFADFPHAIDPLEYPLDELLIMHRLTQECAIELHSCGMVTADGSGFLFVGHSGAGKSTTTRLWTAREDVEVLSDDRIIVRWSGKNSVDHKVRMYGTPWHGEAMYASPGSAPVTRIFILEHGQGNVITRLSPAQAIAELFARSFVPLYRHDYVESALESLQDLVDAVPCYHYAFEPNQAAVEKILGLHD